MTFNPIGIIHSCYKEKFGIPRQAGLVTQATARLELLAEYQHPDIVRELENFSHIWIIFVFHQAYSNTWKPTVRPPRLGGNKRVGVFASRSPNRPNPIGMSLVELTDIEYTNTKHPLSLHLAGADLLDQTPVLDIKPYLPYADSAENAQAAYAPNAPEKLLNVYFSGKAQQQCLHYQQDNHQNDKHDLQILITQILQYDPRPSYKKTQVNDKRIYAMKLYDFDLCWHYIAAGIEVTELRFVS